MSTSKTIFNPLLEEGFQTLSTTAESIAAATLEPTGFEDQDNVEVAYSHANKTVTLSHSSGTLAWWWRGERFTVASPWTSAAHPLTEGVWYLKLDGDITTESWSLSAWTFDEVQVAVANYRASVLDSWGMRETHGLMPHDAHESDHFNIGTNWRSGLTLDPATYTVNGTTDANNSFGVLSGVIADEDLKSTIAALPEGTYTVAHRLGVGGAWVFSTTETLPFLVPVNTIVWNQNTAGTWALANTSENNFMNMFDYVMPVSSDADSQKFRHILVVGQAQFTSLASALLEFPQNLDLGSLVDLSAEFVCVNRITLQFNAAGGGSKTTTGRCAIQNVSLIRGNRASQIAAAGASTGIHSSLSGLAGPDAHPDTAITNTATGGALDVAVETNVGLALARFAAHDYIGAWITSVAYRVGNMVTLNGIIYRCLTAHTSGTFDDDWSLKRWTAATPATLAATLTVSTASAGSLPAYPGADLTIPVVGTGAAPVVASTTPFGATAPNDGQVYRLLGTSDTATVTYVHSDTAKGCLLAGDCELGKGRMLVVQYSVALERYVEVSRSNVGGI